MKTSGIILAGGKSSRMKFNKAFALIKDQPVVKIITDRFRAFFEETIIISNEPELYQDLGFKVYKDIYPGLGPAAGIHSALYHAGNDTVFVMGCDMPFMNMELVRFLIKNLGDFECVLPEVNQRLQPLAAVYNKRSLPIITECLEHNKLKLIDICNKMKTRVIIEEQLRQFGKLEEIFLNVNDQTALAVANLIAGRE